MAISDIQTLASRALLSQAAYEEWGQVFHYHI